MLYLLNRGVNLYFKYVTFTTVNCDLRVFKMVSESHCNKLAYSANPASSEKEMKLLHGMGPSSLAQKVKNWLPYTKNISVQV